MSEKALQRETERESERATIEMEISRDSEPGRIFGIGDAIAKIENERAREREHSIAYHII